VTAKLAIGSTLLAALAASLIVFPAPVQILALLAIVLSEKSYLVGAAAVFGGALGLFAHRRGQRRALWVAAPLACFAIVVALIPPVQAMRLARKRNVHLDWKRYFTSTLDQSGAAPDQTITFASPLALDLYRPSPASAASPAIIVVHGGGWSAGDKGENSRNSRWLANQGFAVFDIQYRLAGPPTWQTAVGDVKCAIGWVKEKAGSVGVAIDPERVALLGRSAGGHLVLLAAYTENHSSFPPSCPVAGTRVAAVVAIYPVTDLQWGYRNPSNPRVYQSSAKLRAFLGGSLDSVPSHYQLATIAHQVTSRAPATLILHGGHDQFVYQEHAHRVIARLQAAEHEIEPMLRPGQDPQIV
jgi:acetyl esterase/lipase